MATYEVTTDDGAVYEVETDDAPEAAPYKPSALEQMSSAVQWAGDKVAPALGVAQKLQNVVSPGSGIPEIATGIASQATDKLGEYVAGKAGEMGAPPLVGGGLGMAAANLPWMALGGKVPAGAVQDAATIAAKPLREASKAAISTTLGPTMEALEARMTKPEAIKNALPIEQITATVPKSLEMVKRQISLLKEKASSSLRSSALPEEGAIPKVGVLSLMENLRQKLRIGGVVVDPASQAADKTIVGMKNKIGQMGGKAAYIPENQLESIVKTLDSNIDWTDKAATKKNAVLWDMRTQLDSILKNNNPQYQAVMRPLAQRSALLNQGTKQLGLEKIPGQGLQPTNRTASALEGSIKGKNVKTQNILERLKKATGADYRQQVKNTAIAKQFQGGRANGSRAVNLGAILGSATGGALGAVFGHGAGPSTAGAAVGAAAGGAVDRFGGQMAAALLDSYGALTPQIEKVLRSLPTGAARKALASQIISRIYAQEPQGAP